MSERLLGVPKPGIFLTTPLSASYMRLGNDVAARKGVKRKPGPESDSGCYVNFPALMIPMLRNAARGHGAGSNRGLLLRPLDRPIRARTHCRDERAGMAQPIRVTSREVSLLPRPECERSSPACDGRRSAGSCQTRCCC